MRQDIFEETYRARWAEFADWLKSLGPRRADQSVATTIDVLDIPARYRELCQQLALARDRQYSAELIDRLGQLVLAGHQALYGARSRSTDQLMQFFRGGFPRSVRREIRFVLVAALLFFGPLLLLTAIIPSYPDFAYIILPAEALDGVQEMYGSAAQQLGRKRQADSDVAMFGFYIFNNVRIGFQTFASGLLFGIGALFYLVYNGLFIGAVTGHLVHAGLARNFFSFTAGHSAFELCAICLSGAAGLKLGYALIAPGRRTRGAALRIAAKESVPLVVGLSTMLLIAAGIEAFWSPRTFVPPTAKYAVGAAMWILLLTYFAFGGRTRGA